jgi:hypothetical protein
MLKRTIRVQRFASLKKTTVARNEFTRTRKSTHFDRGTMILAEGRTFTREAAHAAIDECSPVVRVGHFPRRWDNREALDVEKVRIDTAVIDAGKRETQAFEARKAAGAAMLATEPTTIDGAAALAQHLYEDAADIEDADALGALACALNALAQLRVEGIDD